MHRFLLTAIAVLTLSSPVLAQAPDPAAQDVSGANSPFPNVTFGVQTFLEYAADLHESNNFNAFDVTRGYLNIQARLNDRVRVRFTPDVRPTTDANLNQNLALRMAYASLDARVSDNMTVMFGLHETPWLSYEESVNRYRVLGPFLSERIGLIPGPTDLGASIKYAGQKMEVHAGVYNGEGDGRAEIDAYKSMDGRVTLHPFDNDSELGPLSISGFYQYGWYAKDRPRNVAIVMAHYEQPRVAASLQYLSATDNPFVAVDVQRRGLSFFGEVRQGLIGWAGIIGLDMITPDVSQDASQQRRLIFGGGKWLEVGRGRLGIIGSLETVTQTSNALVLQRRLLAQTQVEF